MGRSAVLAHIQVPPVILRVETQLFYAPVQGVVALFTLAAADDLTDGWHQHVHSRDGPAVIILAHVESLDLFRIIKHDHGSFEVLLRQKALVFGLQVLAPLRFELEVLSGFLQYFNGFRVRQTDEFMVRDIIQGGGQGFIDEAAEQVEVGTALLPDEVHQVADHFLSQVHVVPQVGEGHLRLYHPELGNVARGVGVLRSERRAECVHASQAQTVSLHLKLSRYRQVCLLAEEILAEIDRAVVLRHLLEVQGRHLEQFPGALAVGAGDDGCMDPVEAACLEEAVHSLGQPGADAEHGAVLVGTRAQVGDRTQELVGVAFLLQGIVFRRGADNLHGRGPYLPCLALAGRFDQVSPHPYGRAGSDVPDYGVIFQPGAGNHLDIRQAGTVVEFNERKVLCIPFRPDPPGQFQVLNRSRGIQQRFDGDILRHGSAFPDQAEAVADREHAHIHAVVFMHHLVEGAYGIGFGLLVVRVCHAASPEHVVYAHQAAAAQQAVVQRVIGGVFFLDRIDEYEVETACFTGPQQVGQGVQGRGQAQFYFSGNACRLPVFLCLVGIFFLYVAGDEFPSLRQGPGHAQAAVSRKDAQLNDLPGIQHLHQQTHELPQFRGNLHAGPFVPRGFRAAALHDFILP